ncbi:BMP family ABC transporter substrate-binding protein [Candidatus Villigracilis affinis]|uniref:BMP family lipoprotein n=1 Tax=Candidatus Villigracilis affinis TaxID=3140682 RepID=UPI001DCD0686|nr:BMP family ABC transporter substrate-binding protein [Anaerolineales bacterium]
MKFKIFLLAIALTALTACMQSQDCFSEEVFCAALVTDTRGINDHGMNQETWDGLEESKAGGLADQVEYIESVDARDYEKNIAYFAERGFDVIFTTGPGMDDETLRGADLYPDSVFVGISQPQAEVRPNLTSVTFAEDQMGFLAGVMAARLSEMRVVGAACETSEIDSMWRYCEGFRAGVLSVDENIKVMVTYRENASRESLFIDDDWGYETGLALIRQGADVIFAAGGVTGEGALRAALDEQVEAIGAERDQGAAGYGVVSSVYGRASFEVQNMIRLLRGGNVWEQANGQFGYVPFNQKFPESLARELDSVILGLLNGEIKTNVSPQKP